MDLTVWLPAAGTGPGLLLIQEIYGVSDYIRAVAEDLAGLGYVVAAPDLFWRIEPGYQASHDEAGLKRSLEIGSRFDAEQGVADATAGLRHLRALPEVDCGTGIIGFCLGGSIAYLVAAQAELDAAAADLGAVVSFYGSLIPGNTDGRPPERRDARRGGRRARLPQPDGAHVPRAGARSPGVAAHRGIPAAAPPDQGEVFIEFLTIAEFLRTAEFLTSAAGHDAH